MATIVPRPKPKKKIDLHWLREMTKDIPHQEEDSGTFMRRVRDSDRY